MTETNRAPLGDMSRILCSPGNFGGSIIEACTPKPFILGAPCQLCRVSRGAAVIPERVAITDGDGDASPTLIRAIFGGLYIREDYMKVRPQAQFLVPTIGHATLKAMQCYRRLVEGGLLELDQEQSQFAFRAVCKGCNRLSAHLVPDANDTIRRSCELIRANENFTVTESSTTDLVFRASELSETGMFRWDTYYFFDSDVVDWMLQHLAFDPRYETVRVRLFSEESMTP